MKASTLIAQLQGMVDTFGDHEVVLHNAASEDRTGVGGVHLNKRAVGTWMRCEDGAVREVRDSIMISS